VYKKSSRRSGANILTGWSTCHQGGFKKFSPSKKVKSKKQEKPEYIPIIEWAKSKDATLEIICLQCIHQSTVKVLHMIDTYKLNKFATIRDLKPHLKCTRCQTKGMVASKISRK